MQIYERWQGQTWGIGAWQISECWVGQRSCDTTRRMVWQGFWGHVKASGTFADAVAKCDGQGTCSCFSHVSECGHNTRATIVIGALQCQNELIECGFRKWGTLAESLGQY